MRQHDEETGEQDPAAVTDPNSAARAVADGLAAAYALPHHPTAVAALNAFLAEHPGDDLVLMWHHLAKAIADIYTAAALAVEPPDPADLVGASPSDVADSHARQLVVLCQQREDSRAAVTEYARTLGDDLDLRKWITLALANRRGEADRG